MAQPHLTDSALARAFELEAWLALVEKAKAREEIARNCAHDFQPDGMASQITGAPIRSLVCSKCGERITPPPVPHGTNPEP